MAGSAAPPAARHKNLRRSNFILIFLQLCLAFGPRRSIHLDICEPYDLRPLLSFADDELREICGRHRLGYATELSTNPRVAGEVDRAKHRGGTCGNPPAGLASALRAGTDRHSALIPANLMTFAHLSVSATRILPKSSGVPIVSVLPSSANRALILGSAKTALVAWLSALTISLGVSLGAQIPVMP